MPIKKTTWRPDTCGCKIVYAWDSDAEADKRTHTFVPEESVECEVHAATPDIYEAVLGENQGKNQAIAQVLELLPSEYKKGVVDEDGTARDEFINPPTFSFDKDRNVIISVDGVPVDVKDGIRPPLKDAVPKADIR